LRRSGMRMIQVCATLLFTIFCNVDPWFSHNSIHFGFGPCLLY
jgi:hypothetical protein